MKKNIISEIKKSGLIGRSGSRFPTGLKWEMVKKEKSEKKYIICNASEGEPHVFKDGHILENFPDRVIDGVKIALNLMENSSALIYLRKDYYKKFSDALKTLARGYPIGTFKKQGAYIGGEETSIISAIEGGRPEPKIKPPYPTQSGLYGFPTLVNNVETFYRVSQIIQGDYEHKRLYCVSGDVRNEGVYDLSEDYSVKKILKETDNYPNFEFFVQSGGGACGTILLEKELDKKVEGIGSIIVFDRKKTDVLSLLKKWAKFFLEENCDKCVPCREGTWRIVEILHKKNIDMELLKDLLFVLEKTSFCPLGKAVAIPFNSAIKKLLKDG